MTRRRRPASVRADGPRVPRRRVVALARSSLLAAACGLVAATVACSASSRKNVKDVAETVLTLQTGTVSELKARRDTGPFRDYAVPPAEMMTLVEGVLRSKVVAVFPEPLQQVVVAKEREGKEALDDSYAPAFESAVVVFVHAVEGDAGRSRVEVHACHRGPFRRGSIDWEREVPPLLDQAVAARRAPLRPLR